MKEIIQEIRKSRLKPEEVWFIDFISDIKIREQNKYPNSIFWEKDGEIVFEHDLKDNDLWCHYDKIWVVFETKFGLNYIEIQSLIKSVVGESLNWKGFTPVSVVYLYT